MAKAKKSKSKAKKSAKKSKAARGKATRKPARKAAPKSPSRPKHIPAGTQSVIAYLYVNDAKGALAFYAKAFGAKEVFRMVMPGSEAVMHAEIDLEGCRIMLGEANAEWGTRSPRELGGNGSGLMTYVKDCDASIDRAVKAGCSLLRPAQDMFWGDRHGQVKDPYGHSWSFATHLRDVSPAEMAAAMAKMGS